jgi:hypothetical protein
MKQFKLCFDHNVLMKDRMAEKITEVLSFFNKKSIDVMLIKGAAVDVLVYARPWYTMSSDVDLILRPRKEEIADKDKAEIWALIRGRPPIELDYFEHHDVVMNGTLPVNFQRIWDEATQIKFRGRDVFVMSPEDMLISACINSYRKRFFRLKALCDIAEIINKYSDMKWEELTRKAREYDCNNIVYTALLVTKITLGCEQLPERVFDNLAISPVKATIIRYLSQRMSFSSLSSLYSWLRFSVELKYQIDLDKRNISEDLRQAFENHGRISLSQNLTVTIVKKGSEWLITDKDNKVTYSVRKAKDKLNCYYSWRVVFGTSSYSGRFVTGQTLSGINIFGKKVSLSLILPSATCNWYQLWSKIRNAYRHMRKHARPIKANEGGKRQN